MSMTVKRFIPVCDQELLASHGIPFKRATLYKWKCLGIHPQLFRKVSGKLLLDLEAWKKLVEQASESVE